MIRMNIWCRDACLAMCSTCLSDVLVLIQPSYICWDFHLLIFALIFSLLAHVIVIATLYLCRVLLPFCSCLTRAFLFINPLNEWPESLNATNGNTVIRYSNGDPFSNLIPSCHAISSAVFISYHLVFIPPDRPRLEPACSVISLYHLIPCTLMFSLLSHFSFANILLLIPEVGPHLG